MTPEQHHQLILKLQDGISAAKTGHAAYARSLLLDVVEQDQTNEAAWFWLYQVFDRRDDKRVCLENLITINPGNNWAHRELRHYLDLVASPGFVQPAAPGQPAGTKNSASGQAQSQLAARPVTLWLVSAFWLGISIILLGGGIMAAGEWLASGVRNRTFPDYLTYYQLLELLIYFVFVVAGIIGLNVAAALYLRSMIGFYGSLFLALGLLLIGPTVSLVVSPPSYLTMVCTGGIAGMIFLLTLASQLGYEDDHLKDDNATS